MTAMCEYKSKGVLTWEEIDRAIESCAAVAPNFSAADNLDVTFEMKPSRLPVFDASKHGQLEGMHIEGLLDTKKDPYPSFKEVVLAVQNNKLGEFVNVRTAIGYEDQTCKQTRGNHNSIGLIVENDKVLFTFSDRTALKIKEEGHLRKVYERLIAAGDLPLVIEDVGKYFTLKHCEEGLLSFTACLRASEGKVNPSRIQCELLDESLEASISRIDTILDEVASSKRFSYVWTVWNRQGKHEPTTSGKSHDTELYEKIVELNLPAKRYDFLGSLKCTSIEGVEFIQQLCGPKDHAEIPIFDCQHPHDPDQYLNASIRVTAKGFELTLEASDYIEATELSRMLGIEMEAVN